MDLKHPEYVHGGLLGFGNSVPPTNVQFHTYLDPESVGLSFQYVSTSLATKRYNAKISDNYHVYQWPSFSWSKVTIRPKDGGVIVDKTKDLVISVHLQPLAPKVTKWYITICHNYFKKPWEKKAMMGLAATILTQDYMQMKRQYPENELKQRVLFEKTFAGEEPILWLKNVFETHYRYPDIKECVALYDEHRAKL
jgi:hypothetical protein